MPKNVFEVIAFSFQNIVVFILDFPVCPTIAHDRFGGFLGKGKIGDKGIAIQDSPVSSRVIVNSHLLTFKTSSPRTLQKHHPKCFTLKDW
jgi:hypothetical protein